MNGTIPATVNSTEGLYSAGTSEAEGTRSDPSDSKNARNVSRISSVLIAMATAVYESGRLTRRRRRVPRARASALAARWGVPVPAVGRWPIDCS